MSDLGDAAGLIRQHLWQPRMPDSADHKPWSMGRELSIFKRLLAGWPAEHIHGAITVVREVRRDWDGIPLRLTIFYGTKVEKETGRVIWTGTPLLEMAVGYYLSRATVRKVKLPPTVREVLREMSR